MIRWWFYRIEIVNTDTGTIEGFNTTQPYLEVELEPGQRYEVLVSTVLGSLSSPPVTQTITLSKNHANWAGHRTCLMYFTISGPGREPTPPALVPVIALICFKAPQRDV